MKLSVITINYNNRDGMRQTIESVVGQTFRDFEYIVIDGGSTDGSVDVIKEYADKIDYWVSEKDKGIYNAMNKGVAVAHGEYTQFLNSGDYLCDKDVLEKVFAHNFTEDIVCGNIITLKGGGMIAPESVTMEYFIKGSLPHPSAFIKRELFDTHLYDEQYKISGDWEFFIYHLIIKNASYKSINLNVTVFDTNGISSTTKKEFHDSSLKERVIKTILPPRVLDDYRNYTGETDEYNRLFYIIGQSKYRKYIYKMTVLLLKIVMRNKEWIKSFSL